MWLCFLIEVVNSKVRSDNQARNGSAWPLCILLACAWVRGEWLHQGRMQWSQTHLLLWWNQKCWRISSVREFLSSECLVPICLYRPSERIHSFTPSSKICITGLPWWRSGWESVCQCRGHGFEPWSGKIPHAAEQLGLWATTTEPARLEPVLRNKRGRDSERPAHRDEERPPLAATGESPRTENPTQPKINIKKK